MFNGTIIVFEAMHSQLPLIHSRGIGRAVVGHVFKHQIQHVRNLIVELLEPGEQSGRGTPEEKAGSVPPPSPHTTH